MELTMDFYEEKVSQVMMRFQWFQVFTKEPTFARKIGNVWTVYKTSESQKYLEEPLVQASIQNRVIS